MGDRKLETVAKEVFLSIPPDVRTGVFIDVFTPCDWHHAAQCMVDYAGILDDPREPFAPACDMPVICTTTVTEKTVVSDVRPLVGLPDDAYDDIVAGEMDYVGVRSGTDEPVYMGQLPGSVEQAYDEYVFCQVGVGRFGVSFSPCERRVSGRFGVGRSCWLLVIALVIA